MTVRIDDEAQSRTGPVRSETPTNANGSAT